MHGWCACVCIHMHIYGMCRGGRRENYSSSELVKYKSHVKEGVENQAGHTAHAIVLYGKVGL